MPEILFVFSGLARRRKTLQRTFRRWHGECIKERWRAASDKQHARKWRQNNDSHSGTRNFRSILIDRSFLLEEACAADGSTARRSEDCSCGGTAVRADAGWWIPSAGKPALSSRPHLGT